MSFPIVPQDTNIPAFSANETIRESFPNEKNLSGTFFIFCIGDTIEVKARGLSREQIADLLAKIFQ